MTCNLTLRHALRQHLSCAFLIYLAAAPHTRVRFNGTAKRIGFRLCLPNGLLYGHVTTLEEPPHILDERLPLSVFPHLVEERFHHVFTGD